jgi:hypothetical protein
VKLSAYDMREILYDNNGGEVVLDEMIDHQRWSILHRMVFRKDDHFYQTTYSIGATESQDEQPWEYESEVEVQEVEPYDFVTTRYRVVG